MHHYKLGIFIITTIVVILPACSDKKPQQPAQPAIEVGVLTLKAQNIDINVDLPGRITAYQIAEIRPQVNGIILKRMFEEGGLVKEGQQLYQIDPAIYQATFNTASAQLERAQATVKSATSLNQRYKELIGIQGVSKQELVDSGAALTQALADVAIAKAAKETAQINLNYTKVFSPISGRIGKSNVTPGALVTANQVTPLAVVQQLDPIYADLTQSSAEILKLRQKIAEKQVHNDQDETQVKIVLDDLKQNYERPGILKFSDVTVEQTTGNVSIRAIIPNPENKLLPGLFVRAVINEGQFRDALLVPQQSITYNKDGAAMAWIVDNENKAQLVPVGITEAVNNKWLISKGLTSGQKVIVEGSVKIKPGTSVKPVEIADKLSNNPSNSNNKTDTIDQNPKSKSQDSASEAQLERKYLYVSNHTNPEIG